MVMFQYSIRDMQFGTLKDELISGISVCISLIISDSIIFFQSSKRQVRLFTNKKSPGFSSLSDETLNRGPVSV